MLIGAYICVFGTLCGTFYVLACRAQVEVGWAQLINL